MILGSSQFGLPPIPPEPRFEDAPPWFKHYAAEARALLNSHLAHKQCEAQVAATIIKYAANLLPLKPLQFKLDRPPEDWYVILFAAHDLCFPANPVHQTKSDGPMLRWFAGVKQVLKIGAVVRPVGVANILDSALEHVRDNLLDSKVQIHASDTMPESRRPKLRLSELVLHVWSDFRNRELEFDAAIIRRAAEIASAGSNGLSEGERLILRNEIASGKRGLPLHHDDPRLREAVMNHFSAAKLQLEREGHGHCRGAWGFMRQMLDEKGLDSIDDDVVGTYSAGVFANVIHPAGDDSVSTLTEPDFRQVLDGLDDIAEQFAATMATRFPEAVAGLIWKRSTQPLAAKGPKILVSTDPPQIVIDGQAIALDEQGAIYVAAVVSANGQWISGPDIAKGNSLFDASKVNRVWSGLPAPIQKLIEKQPGKGSRLAQSL